MSAFLAIVQVDGSPLDKAAFQPMAKRIAYRGPDGQSSWINGQVGMGHSLYAVSGADISQPYTLDHITVSGHIRLDGRDELASDLNRAGRAAAADLPDVHLLAQAYLVWGELFLDHLIGDFSFALWDARQQKLIGARDHFGVLPLVYAHAGGALILSTEIGAIRLHPAVSDRLNEAYIGDFLVMGNPLWLDKENTAFADIKRLPPAHKITLERGQISVSRYWTLPHDEPMLRYRSEDEYIEHFHEVFRHAVKDRMRGDRIVLTLSGGLDAPSIAATAVELVRTGQVNAELTAFTAVYDRIHPDNEAYYSSLVAHHLHLPHHLFASDDYPFALPFNLLAEPTYIYQRGLGEAYRQTLERMGRVTIGGYGGDEVLWHDSLFDVLRGMPFAQALELFLWEWRFLRHRPRLELGTVWQERKQSGSGQRPYPVWLNPDFERRLGLSSRYDQLWNWQPEKRHPLHPSAYNIIMRIDRNMLPEFLGEAGGAQAMSSPFLDVRVTRFGLRLPPLPWFERKYLLRRAFRNALPPEILARKKTPLGTLLNSVLHLPGSAWVNEWQPLPELSAYVRRDTIPALSAQQPFAANLANIRPLMLNEWLKSYRSLE